MRFSFGDSYSAFVVWVKTLLPILALGMLSTIFLFSGKVDVTQSLPYAKLNIAEIVREQRITKPYFSGVSYNDTEITLSAAYASSDTQNADILNITDLSIILTSEHAKTVRITAGLGTLDATKQKVTVSKDVYLTAMPDFWLKTNSLTVDLQQGVATADTMFQSVTALGTINAGNMIVKTITNDQQIIFTNGVRLIYYPKPN
ncbi:MAG: lipopolysaccharide export system protein LptC [Planktomarina sp.]|jgi:lipopolysaccharide export system protein LptC|tara:strand:+ start:741 stop:1346 length:606 start_codon:yes stop_codon:yes gene_type:complete